MRNRVLLALSGLVFAAVATLAAPTETAEAARKRPPAPRKRLPSYPDFSRGGIVGGTPEPERRPVTAAWMVGVWGLERCDSPAFHQRLRANGTFSNADERGTWKLDLGQRVPVLAMTYRRDGDSPDRADRFTELAVARDVNDRMQLNIGWWVRCSRNPDASIAGIADAPQATPELVAPPVPVPRRVVVSNVQRQRFAIICVPDGSPSSLYLNGTKLGQGPDCEYHSAELVGTHPFPTGTLYFVFKTESAVFGKGAIVFVPNEGKPRIVSIGYMAAFGKPAAIDRVTIEYRGVIDTRYGESTTICEHRIDWATGKFVASRWVGGGRETRGNCRNDSAGE